MMRRGTAAVAAAVLLIGIAAAALATAESKGPQPIVVGSGNLALELNGDVTPKALPRREFAPVGFWGSVKLSTVDGSHPPPIEATAFDADKDVIFGVEGLPTCRLGQLRAQDAKSAEAVCGEAILGRGSATVEVAFPEQKPFDSTGPLIFFNGGERNGVISVFAYSYVSVPAPTAVIAVSQIRRVRNGAFGLRVVTAFPTIAGGAGSVVAARFSIRRTYNHQGRRRSVISGRCRDGRLQARGTFTFGDGSVLAGGILRPCSAAD